MARKPDRNGRFSCSFSFLSRLVQAGALIIMLVPQHTDPVTRVAHTDAVTRVAHTDAVTRVTHTDAVTRLMAHTHPVMPVPLAMPTQAPSRSRLAIGRITRMAPGITSGGPITSGGRDIGQTATVKESGSAGTMW
jgi:hypothetical protein